MSVKRLDDGAFGLLDREGNWYPLPPELELGQYDRGCVSNGILVVKAKKDSRKYEKDKYGYLVVDMIKR